MGAPAWQHRRGGSQLLPPPPPPPPPLPSQRRRLRQPVRPQGGLYSLPPDLYSSLQTGCGIAYLLALCFSALPALTGDSRERNERRYASPDSDESAGAEGG